MTEDIDPRQCSKCGCTLWWLFVVERSGDGTNKCETVCSKCGHKVGFKAVVSDDHGT